MNTKSIVMWCLFPPRFRRILENDKVIFRFNYDIDQSKLMEFKKKIDEAWTKSRWIIIPKEVDVEIIRLRKIKGGVK